MKKSISILFLLFTLTTNVYGGYDFINNQRVINKIDELADITAELNDFRNRINSLGFTNVTTKFDALDDTKKLEFYYDFRNTDSSLARLNDDSNLIDEWAEIVHLTTHRKSVQFLKNYGEIKANLKLDKHIFKGDLNPREDIPVSSLNPKDTFAANGRPDLKNYNPSGLHSLRPPIPNDVMIDSISSPNTLGYYKAKFRKKPGNGWFNPSKSSGDPLREWTSAKESTFFPDSWTKQKIQEEIALAMLLKVRNPKKISIDEFAGIMSDGVKLKILIDKNSGKIESVFPIVKF